MLILPHKLTTGIHCRVTLTKGRGDIVLAESKVHHNIITEKGLDSLANTPFNTYTAYCHVGTTTNTDDPLITDTQLYAFFASTSNLNTVTTSVKGSPPFYGRRVKVFRFVAGTFSGQEITEVGFSNQAATGNLFSRSLVQLPFATAIAANVRSDEWLDVTYEFRLYPPYVTAGGVPTDEAGVISVNGLDHTYVIRPANVTDNTFWNAELALGKFVAVGGVYVKSYGSAAVLGLVSNAPSSPSGADATTANSTVSESVYNNGEYARMLTIILGPSACNATGGIGAIRFCTGMGTYQMSFNPVVPKTGLNTWAFRVLLVWNNYVAPE